jgi:polyhydroxyalkanoate synthase
MGRPARRLKLRIIHVPDFDWLERSGNRRRLSAARKRRAHRTAIHDQGVSLSDTIDDSIFDDATLQELAVDSPDEAALPANDTSPKVNQSASPQEAVASGALLAQGIMSPDLTLLAPPPAEAAQDGAAQVRPTDAEKSASQDETIGIKPDFDLLSQNLARLATQGAKVLGAFLEPYEKGRARADMAEQIVDAVQSFGRVAEYWLGDPNRAVEAQKSLSTNFLSLWAHTLRRLSGEAEEPIVPYDPSDRRYSAPQWRNSAIFDFLRQAHAITSDWAGNLIARSETDPVVRAKAEFYLRQITSALSPANFVATNPELLRETLASNAENLVRGTTFLAEDLAAGGGTLRIRQSDPSSFEFGVNMAATPGKVVYRNDLIELIQYAPSTDEVYRRPLLVIPPWINKFYILDLNPQKSFVRFAVAQGFTVFLVSWVNPDERHKDMGFEAYLRLGIEAPIDVVEEITGERKIAALGYCVGGTLLAISLALMARRNDDRVASATFLTTQTDFTDAGDLKVFTTEPQIAAIEEMMAESGYLDGSKIANVFNMLRPNDLIWSFFVNNYMRGKPPLPFDLLTWNSDSTRVTAANHSFYLRNCYLSNTLAKGEMMIEGEKLDLGEVTIPVYHLAAREDHIAPARSVFTGAKVFPGDVRYVLAGSGHIAGVINPAASGKYAYWTGFSPRAYGTLDEWSNAATEHSGSWWPDWAQWLAAQAPDKVPARTPGSAKHPPLCDAPGDYVRVRAEPLSPRLDADRANR